MVAESKFTRLPLRREENERITTPPIGFWRDAWRRFRANPLALFGLVVIVLFVLMAFLGPYFTKYNYSDQSLLNAYKPPTSDHLFGTDALGRDLFVRVLYGGRISLAVAVFAGFLELVVGTLYGAIAGLRGGRVDNIMMRIVDIIDTIPLTIYVILLAVLMGHGLVAIFVAIGAIYWTTMARIVRAQVLSLKEQEFMLAARALGANRWRLIMRHLIPNAMAPIIVQSTFSIPRAIFTEAFLSFIGLGVSAPMASWGVLASDGFQVLRSYPTQMLFPSLAIIFTTLAFNFVGDGLRDSLDPKLRR